MRVVIRSQSLRKQQYPYVEGLRAKSVFFAFFVRPHILAQRRSGSCGGCTMSGSHDRGLRVARQAWLTSLTMVMLLLLPPVRRLVTRLVPPGNGPSKDVRENGFFTVRAVGVAKPKVGAVTQVQTQTQTQTQAKAGKRGARIRRDEGPGSGGKERESSPPDRLKRQSEQV